MFATDAVISTKALDLDCPKDKTLGAWEMQTVEHGGIFVQSGIYFMKGKSKSRGIRPEYVTADGNLETWFRGDILRAWTFGSSQLKYPYKSYLTIGAASAGKGLYKYAGHWIKSERVLNLNSAGIKRSPLQSRKRANELVMTWPADLPYGETISQPRKPEWVRSDTALEHEIEGDTANALAGFWWEGGDNENE
jgi:hypothetical protein